MSDDIVRDSNGNQLSDGDSVTVIKDLKVKGTVRDDQAEERWSKAFA